MCTLLGSSAHTRQVCCVSPPADRIAGCSRLAFVANSVRTMVPRGSTLGWTAISESKSHTTRYVLVRSGVRTVFQKRPFMPGTHDT